MSFATRPAVAPGASFLARPWRTRGPLHHVRDRDAAQKPPLEKRTLSAWKFQARGSTSKATPNNATLKGRAAAVNLLATRQNCNTERLARLGYSHYRPRRDAGHRGSQPNSDSRKSREAVVGSAFRSPLQRGTLVPTHTPARPPLRAKPAARSSDNALSLPLREAKTTGRRGGGGGAQETTNAGGRPKKHSLRLRMHARLPSNISHGPPPIAHAPPVGFTPTFTPPRPVQKEERSRGRWLPPLLFTLRARPRRPTGGCACRR